MKRSKKEGKCYDQKDDHRRNYRLYDKEALFVLEKIIALKQVGFSLEENKDNLIQSDDDDIIRNIQSDQNSDESHFYALKHNADGLDWYVKIFNSLDIKEGDRILDLGCGFSKLWRNNWSDIPSNVRIDAYDLHGSWADDFAKFLSEYKDQLAAETDISLFFEDIEYPSTWDGISKKEPYSMVIAHYLMDVLSDPQALVARAADILAPGGLFSVNNICTTSEDLFWIDTLKASGLNPSFAMDKYQEAKSAEDEFKTVLSTYFNKIVEVRLSSPLRFDSPEELYGRAMDRFPQAHDYLLSNKNKLISHFHTLRWEDGSIILDSNRLFWHCYK